MYTIFCDIDGTLLEQNGNYVDAHRWGIEPDVLPGTLETLRDWETKGYHIILTTARRESSRSATEEHLSRIGVFYDQLIMGIGTHPRVLVNDLKPGQAQHMAIAINLDRNQGIGSITL